MSSENLTIVTYPHPALRQKAQPVDAVTPDVRALAEGMLHKINVLKDLGLAANQVNELVRVIVVNIRDDETDEPVFQGAMINPEITWRSGKTVTHDEACLSVPGVYAGPISRDDHVKARFLDLDGTEQEVEAKGLFAHCIQHELDHLNGVLYFDYLSPIKRSQLMKRYEKEKRFSKRRAS